MKARTVRQSVWLLSVRLRLHHLNPQNQDSGLGFTILDIRLVAGCPFLCLRHIENKKAGTECHSFLLLFRNTYSQNDIWVSIETSIFFGIFQLFAERSKSIHSVSFSIKGAAKLLAIHSPLISCEISSIDKRNEIENDIHLHQDPLMFCIQFFQLYQ